MKLKNNYKKKVFNVLLNQLILKKLKRFYKLILMYLHFIHLMKKTKLSLESTKHNKKLMYYITLNNHSIMKLIFYILKIMIINIIH